MTMGRAKSIVASAHFVFGLTALATAANAGLAEVAKVSTPSLFCGGGVAQQSITVKPTYSGSLMVTATGIVNYDHSAQYAYTWCLQLSQTAKDTTGCASSVYLNSSVSVAMNWIAYQAPPSSSAGTFEPYSISALIPVVAGKDYTFYVNGYVQFNSVCYLIQPSITAVFVPGKLPQN